MNRNQKGGGREEREEKGGGKRHWRWVVEEGEVGRRDKWTGEGKGM